MYELQKIAIFYTTSYHYFIVIGKCCATLYVILLKCNLSSCISKLNIFTHISLKLN